MRAIRNLLVALKDPRARSMPAVTKAVQLAQAFEADLHLFHSIDTPIYADAYQFRPPALAALERRTRARWHEELEALAARIRRQGVKVTTSAAWDYPVYEAIIRAARAVKADLIVAEPHAGRRVAPILFHLTDWELLRLSPVPVLIVKTGRRYDRPAILAAVDPAHVRAKAAGLDSEILDAAQKVTAALRGKLHAIHAYVPTPLVPISVDAAGPEMMQILEADARAHARVELDAVLRRKRVPRERRHLLGGNPVDAIPAAVRQTRASLLVMGAVSRSGLGRVFIGSTAERVFDRIACDLLVVKSPQFLTKVARERSGMRLVSSGQLPIPY